MPRCVNHVPEHLSVMSPGHTLVPGIHVFNDSAARKTWMAGTSPAMTNTDTVSVTA
jgi:hypothetical protein